ncbi:MAG: hypothetical protein Q8J78_09215 [Moraxellaceae bacterium]|nr:hypothetical protein [Moraxellaceae bacterium]
MLSVIPDKCAGIPLPVEVAAVWGAFLFEGLLTDPSNPQFTGIVLDAWGQGCIELVIAATLFLPEVWQQISQTWESSDTDFPGVFEYEVISPLGTYLANYLVSHDGAMPDKEKVSAEVKRLIAVFLGTEPLPVLKAS